MRRRTLFKIKRDTEKYENQYSNYMTVRALEDGLTVSIANAISDVKYYYCIHSQGNWIE